MIVDKNDDKEVAKQCSSLAGNILQVLQLYFMLELRAATIVTEGEK